MRHLAIALTLCIIAVNVVPAQPGQATADQIITDLAARDDAAIANLAATADRNTLWRIAQYLQAHGDATTPPFAELPIASACLRLLQPNAHHLNIRNAAAAASAAWTLGISLGPNQQAVATSLAAIAENPRIERRKRAPAIPALAHAPGPQAQAILIRIATRDPDRHHRAAAVTALAERAQRAEFSQPDRKSVV